MRRFSEATSKQEQLLRQSFFIAFILLALTYQNQNGIIQRDLKPQNLVQEENEYMRLIDLCIARINKGNKMCRQYFRNTWIYGNTRSYVQNGSQLWLSVSKLINALSVIVYQNKFHLNRFKQKRGITFKENALDFVNQYQENQEQVVME